MAILTCWICVLAGCFSAAVAEDSGISALYPALWEESPEQLSDYRLEDGQHIMNPWVVTERMGMYRILLKQTAPYFARYAPENEQNLLWGLPLQFGWQYKTGRLADPTGMRDCSYELADHLCVSVDSWWADINYYLSVIPFLAAVGSGVLGISSDQIVILPPSSDQRRFCYTVSGCRSAFPETMDSWNAFFQYMQTPSSDFDGLLEHLWTAHTSSLDSSLSTFVDRYDYYSDQEVNFEKNWAIAVDYLAAARLPTTLRRSHGLQKGLPPHILLHTDIAPFISDFTPLQNEVLLLLDELGDLDRLTGSSSLKEWEAIMSTKLSRKLFLKLLEAFFKTST